MFEKIEHWKLLYVWFSVRHPNWLAQKNPPCELFESQIVFLLRQKIKYREIDTKHLDSSIEQLAGDNCGVEPRAQCVIFT